MVEEIKLCENGCGNEAKYFIKSTNKWQCENTLKKCKIYLKPKYDEVCEIVKLKNGECLFDLKDYAGTHSKQKFRCKDGHIWETQVKNILKGTWCGICAGYINREEVNFIEVLQEKAKQLGGKCLSEKYINSNEKYKWSCENGHTFLKRWLDVKNNSWCPNCNNNVKEEMCRFVFEQLTNKKFPKQPVNSVIKDLELDGYCKELNLAFEYNGEQHYKEVFKWMTRCSLKEIQKRDRRKKKECKKIGINLIIIPYRNAKNKDKIFEFIKKSIFNLIEKDDINWNDFKFGNSRLKKIKKIIESKGGKLISNCYYGYYDILEFVCRNDHLVQSSYAKIIKNKNLCPYCSNQKICKDNCLATTHPKLVKQWHPTKNEKLTPYDVTYGCDKKVWWLCNHGHETKASVYCKSMGFGCKKCDNEKRVGKGKFTYEDVRKYVEEKGCKLLSKEYVNVKTKLKILCSCGNVRYTDFYIFRNSNSCSKCKGEKICNKRRS